MASLIGNEVATAKDNYTQVYKITHEGEKRLPFMKRSFISFTYGGKNIEDFNLIATFKDRIQKSGYANFEDMTSDYSILNGQFYWGSRYQANELSFDLSTDAMDQVDLDEFLRWFTPGKIRELILAEHPNRAILARVSKPPELNLLPFEKKIKFKIEDNEYDTSTTVYRGDISLSFVMDDPHWYGKINIFGHYDAETGIYYDTWTDANDLTVSWYMRPDAIKIAYEDGIPGNSMIESSMMFGDDTYANTATLDESKIATITEPEEVDGYQVFTLISGAVIATVEHNQVQPVSIVEPVQFTFDGQVYKATLPDTARGGVIAGASITLGNGIPSLPSAYSQNNDNVGYLYYCGTAPTRVKLSFNLQPQFDDQTWYIKIPYNSYTGTNYNTFTLYTGANNLENRRYLKFTTPNIYTSYNKAIDLFKQYVNKTFVEMRTYITAQVPHIAVRAWAQSIIDGFTSTSGGKQGETGKMTQAYVNIITQTLMPQLFLNLPQDSGAQKTFYEGKYVFDGLTGSMTGNIPYNKASGLALNFEITEDNGTVTVDNVIVTHIQPVMDAVEDIGDMVKSNDLILDQRNQLLNGKVCAWQADHPYNSYVLFHDVPNGLTNVKIEYKNMYLG